MNAKELREERQRLWNQMQDLLATAKKEARELDTVQYDKMYAQYRAYDKQVEAAEAMEAEEARAAESVKQPDTRDERTKAADELRTAIQTVTTTGGGYTVPTYTYNALIEAAKYYGPMLTLSTTWNSPNGSITYFPTVNDTGNRGYQIAINTDATTSAAAFTFGQKAMEAYKYTSGLIQIPNELMRDNSVNLQAYVVRALGERIGRGINYGATLGNGSGAVNGVVSAAASASVTPSVSALTRANLLDLAYSIDPVYRQSDKFGFMFNDATLKALMKLEDTYWGPVYKPSPIVGEPATIEGFRYFINNDMASIGASAKSVLAGDFSAYWIRLVQNMRILQSDQRYMEYDQTAIVAYWEWDGELMDAGTNPVKYLQHAAS